MKKLFVLCVALFSANLLLAKPYIQQGIAYLYDYKTKTKNPVANVSLTVAYAKGPAISRTDGIFTIEFYDFGAGKKLAFEKQPFSQGLMVLNKKEVDEWSTFEGKLTLIMCNKKDFEVCKQNYYEVGLQSVTQRYEQKIAALQRESADYQQRLQELEEERDRIMDNLRSSADAMARIDQSELDAAMKNVLGLYEQGNVEEAMKRLDGLRLEEGLKQSKLLKERSRKEYQKAVHDSVIQVRNIRYAIQIYNNSGEWDKVEHFKRLLADEVGSPDDIFEYAFFCMFRPEYRDSVIPYFKRVMDVTKKSRKHILYHQYLYATAAYNIGCVYQSRKQTELASKYLEIGIEERKQYARKSPNPNDEGHVAWALVGKANEEISNGLFIDAKQHLKEAGEIYDRIVALNPDEHLWALGRLHAHYGDWYKKQEKYEEAETEYAMAMKMFKEYIDSRPIKYMDYIKFTFGSLMSWTLPTIITLVKLQKLDETKKLLDDIYPYYQKIPLKDNRFREEMANEMEKISDYLMQLGMYNEAVDIDKHSLEIQQRMVTVNPKVYGPKSARSLGDLSFKTIYIKKYSEAEQLAREGLTIDSTQHWIATNLAAALLFQSKYSEAEQIYFQYKSELKESFLKDFERFKAAGVIPKEREEDVEHIKNLLKVK